VLRFPDVLDPAGFLAEHWQKRPLFMHNAIDAAALALTADELAWLATQADVESRLIFTDRSGDEVRYRVESGPFDDSTLRELPNSGWTLLVQDVEKHLPDFRKWFDRVPFIPEWRIDDLMVSFAAPGGSVGPHQDNYDVFLCQGIGRREWRLGAHGTGIPSDACADLSLLQPFAGNPVHVAAETDALYLPPGVPHWGIALDACMTYSIGMRAPAWQEFVCTSERLFPACALPDCSPSHLPLFYLDPDLGADEAAPGLIGNQALRRARTRFPGARDLGAREFATVFGSLVTDPKAWLAPDGVEVAEIPELIRTLPARGQLLLHGMARLAFTYGGDSLRGNCLLFANGFHRVLDSGLVDPIAELCGLRRLDGESLVHWRDEAALREILRWLLEKGAFDLSSE
jgi:50S ribosomal protein L16 3-hydroxylase